jgi:glycosyltransferase involved in cell wall biosynthesis
VPITIGQKGKSVTWSSLLGEFDAWELDEAKALDEHCRRCADEINGREFDILLATSSMSTAVSSIGVHVNTKKVLYLQEPNRFLHEARGGALPWVAIPSVSRPWMHPSYLRWFFLNLISVQRMRVLARDERLNAGAFDLILVNSYFSRESLLRVYGLDSTVCYLGVDTRLFLNQQYPRENFVVSVGEMDSHKNVKFIIKAVAQIAVPRPRLVWIANRVSDSYYEQMRSLAESQEVSLEVRRGVDDNQLVDTLNRAAAMVYAPRLEPFGFAPLEANACGLPVVAVAEGGVRETIIDGINGFLVQHQPQMMAHAIERLIHDKGLAAQLGNNGWKIVHDKWSVSAATERLERQLTQVAMPEASSNSE